MAKKLRVLFRRTILREIDADTVAEAKAAIPAHYTIEHVEDVNDDNRDFEDLCESCGEPIWDDEERWTDGECAFHARCAEEEDTDNGK